MSVNSRENIELLIQLNLNNALYNINKDKFINLLITQANTIHRNRLKYNNNLTEMNKQLLSTIENITRDYIKSNNLNYNTEIKRTQNTTYLNNNSIRLNPRPQIQNDDNDNDKTPKLKIFEENLKKQQANFDSLNKIKMPNEIDFTDKITDEPLEFSAYDSTIKKREEELNNIINKYDSEKTKNWLAPKSTLTDARKIEIEPKNTVQKKVSFNLDNNIEDITSSESFLSKLKPKNNIVPVNNEIKSEILETNSMELDKVQNTIETVVPSTQILDNSSTFSLPQLLNKQQTQLNKHEDILNNILKNQLTIINNQNEIIKKITPLKEENEE
jgi:hypothetical protein